MFKPNMAEMLKQVQKIQEEMARVQEALGEMTVEGSAGGGIVTVTVNGKQQIRGVKIDPEILKSGDVEMLEDLIVAATNQALEKSQEMAKEEFQKISGGMLGNLFPGLKFPGLGF